jgi:hypothetical protein
MNFLKAAFNMALLAILETLWPKSLATPSLKLKHVGVDLMWPD